MSIRFAIFGSAHEHYERSGGWHEYWKSFEELYTAKTAAVEAYQKRDIWWFHIVDLEEMRIVYSCADYDKSIAPTEAPGTPLIFESSWHALNKGAITLGQHVFLKKNNLWEDAAKILNDLFLRENDLMRSRFKAFLIHRNACSKTYNGEW